MNTWWIRRTAREQTLLSVAGLMTFACALYLAVYAPLQTYRENALKSYLIAQDMNNDVRRAAEDLSRLEAASTQSTERDDRPARIVASEVARTLGLNLIRIQPIEEGVTSFWFNGVSSTTLFTWITEMNLTHGLNLERVDIQKSADANTVDAQIALRGAP